MDEVDFRSLYRLQDRVLEAVFQIEVSFYLTGGTCLNRFYREERYSEDLDLFTNDQALFREDVGRVQEGLRDSEIAYRVTVDTRDFVRILVEEALQVDLVNDRVPRVGSPEIRTGQIRLDSVPNILANKISAILGRDEPKDVFDLYLGARISTFSWDEILSGAARKAVIDEEQLQYRLEAFPLTLLESLAVRDHAFLAALKRDYDILCRDVLSRAANSLAD